jgi:hypothetical protein
VLVALEPDRPIFSNREIQGRDYYHLREDSLKSLIETPEKLENAVLILDRAYTLVSPPALRTPAALFFSHLLLQYRHYNLIVLITAENPMYLSRRTNMMASCFATCVESPVGVTKVEYRSIIPQRQYMQVINEAKFLAASKLAYDPREIPSFWTDVSFLKE